MLLLDKAAWTHSAKSFLAAILALSIALAADLPRPYWAMTTAYVVMQPVLGGTNSRGIYRILGTVIASIGVVLIVPNLVDAPLLLSLVMSMWLATFLFIALLNGGPGGYVFLLAGYTAIFVGYPALMQPDTVFDAALARSEEIILGSLCAVVVGAVVFPVSIRSMVVARVDALMGDTRAWAMAVMAGRGSPVALRRRLAGDLSQLDLIIPFARRDDPRHGRLDIALLELRIRILAMLPLLAAAQDAIAQLPNVTASDSAFNRLALDEASWREAGTGAHQLAVFDQLRTQLPVPDDDPRSYDAVTDRLRACLAGLSDLWTDGCRLQAAIDTPSTGRLPVRETRRPGGLAHRHFDWAMMLFSAGAAGATLFTYSVLWIFSGWPDGAAGAMFAAVAAAFFAAQDDPALGIATFMTWSVAAMAMAGIYLFVIFPTIHDLVPLLIAIAPAFLAVGLLASRPKLFLPGMILVTNFASLLSIQNHYSSDFSAYVNSSLSSFIGLLFAVLMTRLFRSVGTAWSAQRLTKRGWRLFASVARGDSRSGREAFTARMLDLIGLLAPRLTALGDKAVVAERDLLDDLQVGLDIMTLRELAPRLSPGIGPALERALGALSRHYEQRDRPNRPSDASTDVQQELADIAVQLQATSLDDVGRQVRQALTGLTLALRRENRSTASQPSEVMPDLVAST